MFTRRGPFSSRAQRRWSLRKGPRFAPYAVLTDMLSNDTVPSCVVARPERRRHSTFGLMSPMEFKRRAGLA